ncbi:hypothetical protein HWB76_gp020 [Streptomyces phage Blueeyedbeauty]|uniref:Uncharacterized protein n=1 Tax=Streptomyces phage Blueeyedbeauty TaxID=2250336 RepID=A0A345L278_9CAUD|nr:hypothetical protein HWB76_gp020 [Streptomyces phage Blueeyedbeauty]AXH49380.1 hypothetical protein SEA_BLUEEYEDBEAUTY_273 [Streptomyces phage Blueeyedbeauty]
MREVMRVCLSEDGTEFLLYSENGETLERVIAVKDFAAVGESAKEAAEIAFRDDYAERNGRDFMSCMGYQDCRPGLCDEHYEGQEF